MQEEHERLADDFLATQMDLLQVSLRRQMVRSEPGPS